MINEDPDNSCLNSEEDFQMSKKLYEVIVTRAATQSTVIRVEADSIEEANDEALRQARQVQGAAFTWELDEDNYRYPDEVYIGDEAGTEEIEPEEGRDHS
jgi:hypothetical protein